MTISPPAQIDAPTLNKQLRATFDSGRTRPLAWREAQLAGLRRMMEEGEDELVEALRADLGRPDDRGLRRRHRAHQAGAAPPTPSTWPSG